MSTHAVSMNRGLQCHLNNMRLDNVSRNTCLALRAACVFKLSISMRLRFMVLQSKRRREGKKRLEYQHGFLKEIGLLS